MRISIIVAAAANNVIGRGGELPWHLPEDLKRFKRLTIGKPVIMGRLTQESIGNPLPDRRNIVLSRREEHVIEGFEVVATSDAALKLAAGAAEVMVIGGGRVYRELLPLADRIYLTRLATAVEGDTFFPELDDAEWRVVDRQDFSASATRPYDFSFVTLDRARH